MKTYRDYIYFACFDSDKTKHDRSEIVTMNGINVKHFHKWVEKKRKQIEKLIGENVIVLDMKIIKEVYS